MSKKALFLLPVLALVLAALNACGTGRPPPPQSFCGPVRCQATARQCRTPASGGCANNDYTPPQPRGLDAAGDCFLEGQPFEPQAACTKQLCSTCVAPDCIDCVATAVPADSCGGCGGQPINAAFKDGPVDPNQTGKPTGNPGPFRVRGYEFTPTELKGLQYEFPVDRSLGTPMDIATIDDVFFVARPSALGGIEFESTGPQLDFHRTLATAPPRTLDGFTLAPQAPPASTFDAFIGADFETAWFEVITGAPNIRTRIPLPGYSLAWAPSPFFAYAVDKPATIGTALSNEVCHADYSIVTGPTRLRCRPSGGTANTAAGVPVGVSAGNDRAWVVTSGPNRAFTYFLPSLNLSQEIDLPGVPVAVSGGTLNPGVFPTGTSCQGLPPLDSAHLAIAVSMAATRETRVLAYTGGNLHATPRFHNFAGTPVTMVTAAIQGIEYGWLLTTNPNRLYRFVISNPAGPRTEIDLGTAEPLRLSVGGTGGVSGAPGDPPCVDVREQWGSAFNSGTVHILVRTP